MNLIPRRGDTYHVDDVNAFIDEGVVESERLDYKVDPHIFANAQIAPVANIRAMVAKAVNAFGNSGGGTLLLGVNEGPNGEPVRTNPPGYPSQINGMAAVEAIDRMIT